MSMNMMDVNSGDVKPQIGQSGMFYVGPGGQSPVGPQTNADYGPQSQTINFTHQSIRHRPNVRQQPQPQPPQQQVQNNAVSQNAGGQHLASGDQKAQQQHNILRAQQVPTFNTGFAFFFFNFFREESICSSQSIFLESLWFVGS